MKAPGPLNPGTWVPKFFNLETAAGQTVHVVANATEHLAEMVVDGGAAASTEMGEALLIEGLDAAVSKVLQGGLKLGEMHIIDGWELIIVAERTGARNLVPLVLKHARYILASS